MTTFYYSVRKTKEWYHQEENATCIIWRSILFCWLR